jgi:hypothetical protein
VHAAYPKNVLPSCFYGLRKTGPYFWLFFGTWIWKNVAEVLHFNFHVTSM